MYLAGIVLYNPEISFVKKNIISLIKQNFEILLIDNGSKNVKEVKDLERESVTIILNYENKGIAKALNQICDFALSKSITWVLTLDQDSIVPDNILKEYLKRINYPKIAIICPAIVERNINTKICGKNLNSDSYVKKCITSASFINIGIWEKVGKFDNEMFIDYVDFDYSYRVRKFGYKILRVPSVCIMHTLGESELRRFLFWKVRVSNHSSERKYYISRNIIIFIKKNRDLRVFLIEILRLAKVVLFTILYEKNKTRKMVNILKGMKDGLLWREKRYLL